MDLTDTQKSTLLKLARKTIANNLGLPDKTGELSFDDDIFRAKCGAFVTLHKQGSLRGCIGYIQGVKPIPETVEDMAKAAAFRDPRFTALSEDEFDIIDIEVSVLTPIVDVADVNEIEVGRDGIIISKGYNSGLLLPQVATEQGWDRDTFLTHTCYKAGLPGDAWKEEGTKIQKFSALVFGEKEMGLL